MELRNLGFDEWFAARAAQMDMHGGTPARVVAVDRGGWRVRDAEGEIPAEVSGRLSFGAESPAELPCVGDWVAVRRFEGLAVIDAVLPRRTFLRRKTAGAAVERQMIAANIDTAFLVQSCQGDFNPRRLERYLAMAAQGGATPVVVLTKADLADPAELARKVDGLAAATRARVLALSCVSGEGLDALRATLTPGETYCLLGSSGVGKTTLTNLLLGRQAFATRAVSGTGEGVHTTTRRQLVRLAGGALLVDTPGMRELGLLAEKEDIDAGCPEVAELAARCRFADCRHENEPGCAVRAAVERGELSAERLANYRKLRREAAFNALSYRERRDRDKTFGKMVRAVKKDLRG